MKFFLILFLLLSSLYAKKPELFLLNVYSKDINVSSWYMSEKLDGVRAYWDGKRLISRAGNDFNAPSFFTKKFPSCELDGELWSKREDFSNINSIVSTEDDKARWSELTYNIFEVPNAKGGLLERLSLVKKSKYIKLIKQIKVRDNKHLEEYLKELEIKGAEGLVVRDGSLDYYAQRNNNALKVKSFNDTECEVVNYTKGKGKYKDMVGSLVCKMQDGKIIKIGSGLSDAQRADPPKIGAIITFKYYGLTSKGNPRFPVFLRIRN
ncbi:MAG: DNA ligase [Sulfurimonas sp.]|uniref:DNA ligase n=1 Tax=Sulfurimonas sp. TaxID=2022749 RepID=UPI0025F7B945|nr:DNA ligase [Sulfurimonas sp.]MCK9491496.1 DNA ligase [Sulfurimonas sp.]